MSEERIRPLFIIGPEGCGKSTYIQQLAKKENRVLLRCPCRKDRTLREQRARIHEWALRAEPTLLWLEGTDDLTPEAQSFLRRVLETYAPNVRFCLEGRTLSSIQEPILSRCDIHRIHKSTIYHPIIHSLSDTTRNDILDILKLTNNESSIRKQQIAANLAIYYPSIWTSIIKTVRGQTYSKKELLEHIKNAEDPWLILWTEYDTYSSNIQNDINIAISQIGNPWAILGYARAASQSS
jgi:DNA polymerase III delta prime subunit